MGRKNERRKPTDEEIHELSEVIRHETNLLYLIIRAADTIVADLESRLKKYPNNPGITGEVKLRLKQYIGLVGQTAGHFENFVEPVILNAFEGNWSDYEKTRIFANELIRLLMMYYEKCNTCGYENHSKVFDLLNSLEDGCLGVFTDMDINRFNLGCK